MAHQLNRYDEASLMSLWEFYAAQVADFEPSERWQEAVICLCMIQSVYWKNQLFNKELASSLRRGMGEDDEMKGVLSGIADRFAIKPKKPAETTESKTPISNKKRSKVLVFRKRDGSKA